MRWIARAGQAATARAAVMETRAHAPPTAIAQMANIRMRIRVKTRGIAQTAAMATSPIASRTATARTASMRMRQTVLIKTAVATAQIACTRMREAVSRQVIAQMANIRMREPVKTKAIAVTHHITTVNGIVRTREVARMEARLTKLTARTTDIPGIRTPGTRMAIAGAETCGLQIQTTIVGPRTLGIHMVTAGAETRGIPTRITGARIRGTRTETITAGPRIPGIATLDIHGLQTHGREIPGPRPPDDPWSALGWSWSCRMLPGLPFRRLYI